MASPPDTNNKTRRSPILPANLRNALSLPPKWLSRYDDFVTKNASQVSQMESALRSLTYIIPGRFRDAELATEGIHSGVQLLSLYHDLLLFRSALSPQSPPSSSSSSSSRLPALAKSLHARYTRFWTARSTLYRRVAVVLQVVQYTELLLEMWAKRRGEAVRWRVVVLVEALKAFCRLLLLRITRSRPLVAPALPEREQQPLPEPDEEAEAEENKKALAELMGEDVDEEEEEKEPQRADENGNGNATTALVKHNNNNNGTANGHAAAKPPSSSQHAKPPNPKREWPMPRTGLTLPSLPARGDISSYLLTRVLTADDIKPATRLLQSLRGSAHAAEILHILSPLIYALALARNPSSSSSSWTPWLIGVAVQVIARQLRDGQGATALEREVWARRGRAMWWWLMRGAAYDRMVKGAVGGVTRRVPGFVGTILEDYEYLWENYYFSTSDS